jgi:hypothetical protein
MKKVYNRTHTKVWKQHYGKIPKDEDGRSYEIHHIDGNPKNNNIENLCCVSIREHYEIHLSQGDYGGAFLIAKRMKIDPKEISELARKISLQKMKDGTHNFLSKDFKKSYYHNTGFVVCTDKRTNQTIRVTKQEFDNNDFYVGVNSNRKQKKIHDNRGHNKGKKWTQKNKEEFKKCQYCDFVGRGSHIKRYHNERCKKYNGS